MTREEYLIRLTNELYYDEERLRVVAELLDARPDMSPNDFDVAWATSRLAWRVWRTLMEEFELPPDSMARHLTMSQLTACYRLFQGMLAMFDTALRDTVEPRMVAHTTDLPAG